MGRHKEVGDTLGKERICRLLGGGRQLAKELGLNVWAMRCILQGLLWGRGGSALWGWKVLCAGVRSLSDVEG